MLFSKFGIILQINESLLIVSGVVNRGDSFRRRRSRSNSLLPPGTATGSTDNQPNVETHQTPLSPVPSPEVISYSVAMLGAPGVGKTALVSQFMTSECINAYDRQTSEYTCVCLYTLTYIRTICTIRTDECPL